MRLSFHGAVLAAALAACSGPTGHEDLAVVVPAGACTVSAPDLTDAEHLGPVKGVNGCKIIDPWRLKTVAHIHLSAPATVTCGIVSPLRGWLDEIVQPAAVRAFGERVVGVDVAASYACRTRNSNAGAKMSEHGYGKAIDISAFTLVSGRRVTVAVGWSGNAGERAFLREIHKKACGRFSTVLGPTSDTYHRDHIHLDIQQRKSGKSFCR